MTTPTITLPATGSATTNYGLQHPIRRADLAEGIWNAVNRYGSVRFVRVLKGDRCAGACQAANPDTWKTCSCACGGAHHGGGDHGLLIEIDPEANTATVTVTRDNIERVTGLKLWERNIETRDRVEYTGEYRPSLDGESDLATVLSTYEGTAEIRWDYSGETEEVSIDYLVRITNRPAA